MRSLIVYGGRLRRIAGGLHRETGAVYAHGVVAELDLETRELTKRLEWRDPEWESVPDISHVIKGGSWNMDQLLLCTERNLLWVDPHTWRVTRQWSHPAMNDVHHALSVRGTLYVACAGLDAVLEVHADDKAVIRGVARPVEMPWTDQRTLDLAPHRAHPNYLFEWQRDVWVTRFQTRDAAPLHGRGKRSFHLGRVPVHDGLVTRRGVFFTSVDGKLLQTGVHGLTVQPLQGPDTRDEPLGWCAGLCLDRDGTAWVGFSRLRNSHFREHMAWVGSSLQGTSFETRRPTRLQQHDPRTGALLDTVDLESVGIDEVFGLLPRG